MEIEKLFRERERTEAKRRRCIKRAAVAEAVDAVALASRAVKVMENAKARLEAVDERLRTAVKTFEDSVGDAFSYEALLRQVVPLTLSWRECPDRLDNLARGSLDQNTVSDEEEMFQPSTQNCFVCLAGIRGFRRRDATHDHRFVLGRRLTCTACLSRRIAPRHCR